MAEPQSESTPNATVPAPEAATPIPKEVFPSNEALSRSILVDNISPLATSATLEDFFNFCGTIEDLKLRKLPNGTQQSAIVFSDEPSRENALVMNRSSILDTQVTITPIPEGFNFYDDPPPPPPPAKGLFGGGFSAFGDLFNGVGSSIAAEVEKASKVIDQATDSGVLKQAKDQMTLVRQKTADFASDIDNKWKVRENVKNVTEISKERASNVANVVATSTSNLASQVDKNLHISENTTKLAQQARQNQTVNTGLKAVTGGFQTLLAQTGLQGQANQQNDQEQSPVTTESNAADTQQSEHTPNPSQTTASSTPAADQQTS